MAHFGGMGGLSETRPIDTADRFEMTVEKALGDLIRSDQDVVVEMWSALANVEWSHSGSADTASYSFRAAGDMIAAIRGEGNYLDWYCSGEYAVISDRICQALSQQDWVGKPVQ